MLMNAIEVDLNASPIFSTAFLLVRYELQFQRGQ